MVMQMVADSPVLDAEAVQRLRERLAGELILPSDGEYDARARCGTRRTAATRPWWCAPTTRRTCCKRCASRAGRELPLSVRSGGHSMAGHGAVEGGVMLNLSAMKGLSVDPERRVAWAQPGVTAGEYGAKAQEHGLATPFGDVGSVGIAGLTLGGGIGYLARKHGLAIDHLLSADVVTADGRLLTASETEHPDLFWALRGGGGNFGVVTGLEYRLRPVGMIVGGALFHEASAQALLNLYRVASAAPEELTTIAFVLPAPPLPFIPAEKVGSLVLMTTFCYAGDVEAGMAALAPLKEIGTPVAEVVQPMPYTGLYQLTAEGAASRPHAIRTGFANGLDRRMAEAIMAHARGFVSPFGAVQLRVLGGAMSRVPAGATAFAHRDKTLMLNIWGAWDTPGEASRNVAWLERAWGDLGPMTDGAYVNFLENEGRRRVRDAYPTLTRQRLEAIKGRYDPTNFFRINQNIRPAGQRELVG